MATGIIPHVSNLSHFIREATDLTGNNPRYDLNNITDLGVYFWDKVIGQIPEHAPPSEDTSFRSDGIMFVFSPDDGVNNVVVQYVHFFSLEDSQGVPVINFTGFYVRWKSGSSSWTNWEKVTSGIYNQ